MIHNTSTTLPIGVFDSGMGGLTVLKSLAAQLPNESFIYLGDTARLPYGTKSKEIVVEYARENVNKLLKLNVKMIVIACNTATVASLEYLQKMHINIPIIGVVEPGAITAAQHTSKGNIAIIATEGTVLSKCYQNILNNINPNFKISTKACNLLVSLAEEGHIDDEIAKLVLQNYVYPLLQTNDEIDVLLLGCTHFPVFSSLIRSHIASTIKVVDSAECTARFVTDILKNKQLFNHHVTGQNIQYYVTDSPERFSRVGKIFLEKDIRDIKLL